MFNRIRFNILINGLCDEISFELLKDPDLTTNDVINLLSGNTRLTDEDYFDVFMAESLYKYSKASFGYETSDEDTLLDDIKAVVDIHIEECVLNKLRMELRELNKRELVQ